MILRPSGKTEYTPPSYHSGSFGRRSTKPPWFSIQSSDRLRRPIEEWGNPRNIPRVPDKGAPFRLSNDNRCDRPIITKNGVDQPATPRTRMNVPTLDKVACIEYGQKEKAQAIREAYKRSRMQYMTNLKDSKVSDVREIITGSAPCVSRPILYPYRVDHRIALALENKVGPKPWYDERPAPDSLQNQSPKQIWDQTMYVKYSRTRSDFPYLVKKEQPIQEP